MGQKGDKHTPEAKLNAELLVQKLSLIEGITSKKMFGGHGIFHEGQMFAMLSPKGGAFLRTDDATSPQFENKGSTKHGKMPYHTIPDEIFNSDEPITWAKKSIEISKT